MKQTVKHILRALLLVAVAAAMGSCVLGRKYQSPELNLPDRLSDSAPDNDSLLFADMRWWEVYSDTTLRNLISATLANNKDMRIAAERVQELAQLRRIDNAAMLPQIGGTAYGEREWENYGGNNPDVSPNSEPNSRWAGSSTSGAISAGHAAREWRNTSNRWRRSGHCK